MTLDGEALFSVHGIQSYPAEKRATAIGNRIRAMAADRAVPIESLRVVEKPHGSDILAGDRFLMSVLESDGSREGVAHQNLAKAIRQRIAEAIAAYRAERTLSALLLKTAYTLGAMVVACLLVLGVRRGFRWVGGYVERRAQSRMAGLEEQSFRLLQAAATHGGLRRLFLALRMLAVASIAYGYLHLVLGLFPRADHLPGDSP